MNSFNIGDIIFPTERADAYSITNRKSKCVCMVLNPPPYVLDREAYVIVIEHKNRIHIGKKFIIQKFAFEKVDYKFAHEYPFITKYIKLSEKDLFLN